MTESSKVEPGEMHKHEKTGPIYLNDGQTIFEEDEYQTEKN